MATSKQRTVGKANPQGGSNIASCWTFYYVGLYWQIVNVFTFLNKYLNETKSDVYLIWLDLQHIVKYTKIFTGFIETFILTYNSLTYSFGRWWHYILHVDLHSYMLGLTNVCLVSVY